jgi:VIT1/CCC1 family predicted Fe2+/Mn2+ transporter
VAGAQPEAYGPGLGWSWRSFPTFAAFAVGGLIPSIIYYFAETTGLAFVLYLVFLLLTSFALMHYMFRWTRIRRARAAQQRKATAQGPGGAP